MNRNRVLLLLLALLFLLTACSAPQPTEPPTAAPTEPPTEAPPGQKELQNEFDAVIRKDGMQGAVYAVYRDKVVYDKGFGMADDEHANGADVLYGVASLTKQFTAACIMQLYEAKKLDLDDDLSRYFPDYAHAKEITLRQLLSLRSGIPDYSVETFDGEIVAFCTGDEEREDAVTLSADNTARENIELIRGMFLSRDLLFTPGEQFDYSDSDYALLAAIVEQVSGEAYHDYIRRHLFEPLQLEHASFIDDASDVKGAVIARADAEEFDGDYYAVKGAEYGCGDVLISPRELYQWYGGLFGGKVVSEESLRLMTENHSSEGEAGYGFGLMLSQIGDHPLVYHTGWLPSRSSIVCYLPEDDYWQLVVTNRVGGNPYQVGATLVNTAASLLLSTE